MALMVTASTLAVVAPRWAKATKASSRPWPTITLTTETAEYLRPWVRTLPKAEDSAVGSADIPGSLGGGRARATAGAGRHGPSTRALARATRPSHSADGFTVRRWVARSTATRPNVGPYPKAHSKLSSSDQYV